MGFTEYLNFMSLVVIVLIGFYCAHKLNNGYPLWVRLVVLSPSLTSFYKISEVFRPDYSPITSDLFQRLAVCLLYALVASKFSAKPWLDKRCSNPIGHPNNE